MSMCSILCSMTTDLDITMSSSTLTSNIISSTIWFTFDPLLLLRHVSWQIVPRVIDVYKCPVYVGYAFCIASVSIVY